jgi:hypothetical protein
MYIERIYDYDEEAVVVALCLLLGLKSRSRVDRRGMHGLPAHTPRPAPQSQPAPALAPDILSQREGESNTGDATRGQS